MRLPYHLEWLVGVVVIYGLLYWLAGRSVYYPMRHPDGMWELQQPTGAADVWLMAPDGVKVHAWWTPAREARFATLFLHGNAGNITHRTGHIGAITAAGSSILVIDYRGYGKSEGSPSEAGLYRDAGAAYDHLIAAGYKPERIVVHGESLGTAVAVELAARRPCAGVVLEAPFSSAKAIAGSVLPLIGPLLISSFDSRTRIKRVRAPLLVIHGDRDTVIPFALGRALFEAANEPKSFWKVDGAGHNDLTLVAGPRYRERLAAFYASLE